MLAKTVKKRTGLIQPTKAGGAGPAKSQKKREKERFRQQQQQSHVVRKPILQSSPGGSFAEKLCRVRSMSPRSRKQTNAEALQWQAAIATVEAERNGPMLVPIPVATAASKSSKARVPREAPVTVTEGPGHFAMFAPTPIAEQYSHELEGIEETEMSEDGGN